MSKQNFRTSSLLCGVSFIVIAAVGLFGGFAEADRARLLLPLAVIAIGVTAIGNGVRALLAR